jgi:hypothetical protein
MKRQKAILLRERSYMRIYDVIHGRIFSTDTHKKYRMHEEDHEKRLDEIRKKIRSGYYEQPEILEKVVDAIYRHIK